MNKKILISLTLLITVLTGGFGIYVYLNKEPKANKSSNNTVEAEPTTDEHYYYFKLQDGNEYVGVTYNYPDGRLELFNPFILVNNELRLWTDYNDEQVREDSSNTIRQYDQRTGFFIQSKEIVTKTRLENSDPIVLEINNYFERKRQQNPNPLN